MLQNLAPLIIIDILEIIVLDDGSPIIIFKEFKYMCHLIHLLLVCNQEHTDLLFSIFRHFVNPVVQMTYQFQTEIKSGFSGFGICKSCWVFIFFILMILFGFFKSDAVWEILISFFQFGIVSKKVKIIFV